MCERGIISRTERNNESQKTVVTLGVSGWMTFRKSSPYYHDYNVSSYLCLNAFVIPDSAPSWLGADMI